MRHDASPQDMAHGFHRVLWENACYWQGIVHLCSQRRPRSKWHEEKFWAAVNGFALIGRRSNRTHFERVAEGVKRRGMGELPPHIKGDEIPAHLTNWSAFRQIGACQNCLSKQPIDRRSLLRQNVRQFAGRLMNGLWHSMIVSVEYGRFHVRTLENNSFFNEDDNAYFIEQHFSGGLGTLGKALECYPTPVQAYDFYLAGNEKNADEWRELLSVRVRGITGICDMALERDWCATCQSDLVTIPYRPIPDPQ